jgi:hypothetical protein
VTQRFPDPQNPNEPDRLRLQDMILERFRAETDVAEKHALIGLQSMMENFRSSGLQTFASDLKNLGAQKQLALIRELFLAN